jgi:ATP-binding cassette, subfamily B, bacterial
MCPDEPDHQVTEVVPAPRRRDSRGWAALAIALRSVGVDVAEDEVRRRALATADDVPVAEVLRVARSFGVSGRGVRVEFDGLRHLPPGSLLYLRPDRPVVLAAAHRTGLAVVDPATGPHNLTRAEVEEAFAGTAVEFYPPSVRPAEADAALPRWSEVRHFLPGRSRWIAALVLSAVLLGLTLVLPLVTQQMIDNRGPEQVADVPWLAALLLALTIGAYGTLQVLRGRAIVALQATMERDSMRSLFLRMIRLPYSFFATRHPAELAQCLRTSSRLRDMIAVPTVGALLDAALVVVYLIGIALLNPFLSLVVVALVSVLAVTVLVAWRRQSALAADALAEQISSASVLQETLENIITIKSLGAESEAAARWRDAFASEIISKTRRDNHGSTVSAVTVTVQFSAPLLVLGVGVWQVVTGAMTLGQVLAVSTLALTLFVSLNSLAQTVMQLSTLVPEFARVREILAQAHEPLAAGVDSGVRTAAIAVTMRKVRYHYPGEEVPAVKDVDLDVPAGSYVGILGASGSGKSTLGLLIAGLDAPTAGTVHIDGVRRQRAVAPEFRELIGYVEQSSRVLSGSVLENVRFGRADASFDEVVEALKLAGADEFVQELPMHYYTILGKNGIGLSGGQRQRLALARAVVKKPPLLILDEATNAVDPATETRVLANLRRLGCTLVVLGHRLNLVEEADQVVVLEQGRVAATGTPEEIRRLRGTGSVPALTTPPPRAGGGGQESA